MKLPWMDRMLPGMWRCVPFWVEQHTLTGGRRLVVHEFPVRDEASVDDIGRKARRFQVSFFGGNRDYFYWRDEMRAALDEPGPGTLSHPYLGELRAQVEDYSISESASEGGLFRAQVTFVEATSELRVVTEIDHAGRAKTASDAVLEAASESLAESVVAPELKPGALLADELRILADAEAVLDDVGAAVSAALALASAAAAIGDALAFAAATIDAVRAIAHAGVSTPGRAPEHRIRVISSAGGALGKTWPDPTPGLPAQSSSWSPTAATPRQVEAAREQHAVSVFGRTAIYGALAEATVEADFGDADAALEAASQLDTLADAVLSHEPVAPRLHDAVCDLRVALEQHLRSIVPNLPRRARFTPATTLPAVVIAQRLYGDAQRASQIVALNGIAHPLFVRGGEELEVLTDA